MTMQGKQEPEQGQGQGQIDPETVRENLRGIVDPCSDSRGIGNDIVELGLVESIDVDGGDVTVHMRMTTPTCTMIGYFVDEMKAQLEPLDGVDSVTVEADSGLNWSPELMEEQARERREAYLDRFRNADPEGDLST